MNFQETVSYMSTTDSVLYLLSQSYAKSACSRTLPCGHACGGILNEKRCLPCLHGCHTSLTPEVVMLKQDAEDMCMICFTEALSAAPAIQVITSEVLSAAPAIQVIQLYR